MAVLSVCFSDAAAVAVSHTALLLPLLRVSSPL